MKPTLTIILFLVWTAGMGQIADLRQLHKQYIEYCNEIITDTIEEYGEVEATKEVPIYDGCEQIVGYRSIPAKDTVWKGYKCKEWKTVHTNHALLNTEEVILGGFVLSVDVATHHTYQPAHVNHIQHR